MSEGLNVASKVSGGDVLKRNILERLNVAKEVSGGDVIKRDILVGLSTGNFSSVLSGGDVSNSGEEGNNFLRQALKLKSQSEL